MNDHDVTPNKPRLLVISAVYPFPGAAGQQQRVMYKLLALRSRFHITFLTFAEARRVNEVCTKLQAFCDEAIVLPSRYASGTLTKAFHRLNSTRFILRTGLKGSNYVNGRIELSPERIAPILDQRTFDLALLEYWHTISLTETLRQQGIPSVLDMHDVLWQSYTRQLNAKAAIPVWWKRWAIAQYKHQEEAAWSRYDALISINAAEGDYARQIVGPEKPIFYAPMGTDLAKWPYAWQPATNPPRVCYYGGLGSPHNQQDALRCFESIMPKIWHVKPSVEFWIVGSNPPPFLKALAEQDARVKVTGYVEQVQDILNTMTASICPWAGTYGFRSRLIEVMALGVPVVATPDAVYGMDLHDGPGLILRQSESELAAACIALLKAPDQAKQHSVGARAMVQKFSYDATYGKLADDLLMFARSHTHHPEPF